MSLVRNHTRLQVSRFYGQAEVGAGTEPATSL